MWLHKSEIIGDVLHNVSTNYLHSFFIENTFFRRRVKCSLWKIDNAGVKMFFISKCSLFWKVTKTCHPPAISCCFLLLLRLRYMSKKGLKKSKSVLYEIWGQSEMFSLKKRRTQSLFLKNMFSIKKKWVYPFVPKLTFSNNWPLIIGRLPYKD